MKRSCFVSVSRVVTAQKNCPSRKSICPRSSAEWKKKLTGLQTELIRGEKPVLEVQMRRDARLPPRPSVCPSVRGSVCGEGPTVSPISLVPWDCVSRNHQLYITNIISDQLTSYLLNKTVTLSLWCVDRVAFLYDEHYDTVATVPNENLKFWPWFHALSRLNHIGGTVSYVRFVIARNITLD